MSCNEAAWIIKSFNQTVGERRVCLPSTWIYISQDKDKPYRWKEVLSFFLCINWRNLKYIPDNDKYISDALLES